MIMMNKFNTVTIIIMPAIYADFCFDNCHAIWFKTKLDRTRDI